MDLKRLSEFFPPEKIEFLPGVTNKEKNAAIAIAYVTARAIQDRLDEVCGPENWKNEFVAWKGEHQLCGISIRVDGEWITKWDGAENTDIEPLKGGLSSAFKRAAAQWGIGRYLYEVPSVWYPIVPRGKSFVFDSKNPPKLPSEYLPKGCKNEGYQMNVTTAEENEILNLKETDSPQMITEEQLKVLGELIVRNGFDLQKIYNWGKVKSLDKLTGEQFNKIIDVYGRPEDKYAGISKLNVSAEEQERLAKVNKKVGNKK